MVVTAVPEFDPDCATYIAWAVGFSLPETFGALVRDDDLPWRIRLKVFVERDGIAKCTSLTVDVPDVATIGSGGAWEPVTPSGFRSVRLSACLEAACLAAAIKIQPAPDGAVPPAKRKGNEPAPRPARPMRGHRTPDEFLRGVAHVYLEATRSDPSLPPRPAVEEWYRDQYHASIGEGVTDSWFRQCRQRIDPETGRAFLPKAKKGRRVNR
jgi:hypothetical protein